jgi:hypothetical protein
MSQSRRKRYGKTLVFSLLRDVLYFRFLLGIFIDINPLIVAPPLFRFIIIISHDYSRVMRMGRRIFIFSFSLHFKSVYSMHIHVFTCVPVWCLRVCVCARARAHACIYSYTIHIMNILPKLYKYAFILLLLMFLYKTEN